MSTGQAIYNCRHEIHSGSVEALIERTLVPGGRHAVIGPTLSLGHRGDDTGIREHVRVTIV